MGDIVSDQQVDALKRYAQSIRDILRSNPTNIEQALAPSFKNLLDDLLATIVAGNGITTVPEYAKADIGRPDIALIRAGQLPRAFVELKAPAKSLDASRWRDGHDKRQFERFGELPTWALSNFSSVRFYRRSEGGMEVRVVPERALDPSTGDAKANALIDAHDPEPFLEILSQLAQAQPPTPTNASQLAEYLAHAARLVRASVIEQLGALQLAQATARPLQMVREEFRNILYAHPEAGGYRGEFDTLFSAAFAQTLAFGLLLVREATNQPVHTDSWRDMPDEHPLMKTALRVLSEPEIVAQIDLGFEVLIDTINGFDPAILSPKRGKPDPILYFYEEFLATFDADAKQRYGVYYTPVEVVRYMVGALDRVLREDLKTEGLVDSEVTILDPAVGTGTFLLGIAERVRDHAERESGPGAVTPALRQLAERMFGFELLIGPYAVAHYRLHHALAEKPVPGAPPPPPLPRLGIYLADTLARAGTSTPLGSLGYTAEPIRQERDEADRIKRDQSILAIIGNPPYWRFQGVNTREVVGPFVDDLWEDLKEPVRQAGWANQLNTFPEFSIAFWRWSMWKLFEADNAPKKGVIAFISNRTFLAGKPYAGLRKMLRERFDRIEVIDLRGDLRRGARAGVLGDEGVFNIQVGTAITIAVADGSKAEGALAEVRYTDAWEQEIFPRKAKLAWLEAGAEGGKKEGAVEVCGSALAPLRPPAFNNVNWPSLADAFEFQVSGMQTKRDHFVYSVDKSKLLARLRAFAVEKEATAREQFHDSRDRKWAAAQANVRNLSGEETVDESLIVQTVYRPLDRRHLFNHAAFGDFLRPGLQQVWGKENVGLYAMPFATGEGPAAWCHAHLPDYHSFSGRGGYAFPLFDRRAGHDPVNLSPALIEGLALAYHAPVEPQAVFDAILGLLSATSYTLRFAEDLEDVFPHIPFPADRAVFEAAAAVGKSIREVETFARPPGAAYLTRALGRIETTAHGPLAEIGPRAWAEGELTLGANGSGRVSGIPAAVWTFAVSGYPLLPRWLAGRKGTDLNDEFLKEFRDINGRINELIHRFDEADLVLEQALTHSLSRDELGLTPAANESDDERS
jgi:hypothetical protein